MMKTVYVDYEPLGVIGAIVPWNYPFHNLFNPISAALFAGNAIVIKVSEFASWSVKYYKKIIDAALISIGAPVDLVQFVIGYGPTGSALVSSEVNKLIFVGSPEIGIKVAQKAAETLKPVVLELGGKDPFIVLDDYVITDDLIQIALRGVFQNMGQNCAGPERFFIYEKVYEIFINKLQILSSNLTFGKSSLVDSSIDCGAICMGPKQLLHYQRLVDDAVAKGAKIMIGGFIPTNSLGSYYPPTIIYDVPYDSLIAKIEIFGPIMCIFKVTQSPNDELVISLVNKSQFALSACCFSNNKRRAEQIIHEIDSGMAAINDLEGCTYMSQSLPFGGKKHSGYDRFAGPEGLRGLCHIKSVCVDRFFSVRTTIPPAMQYPASLNNTGPKFAMGLINMFYGTSIYQKLKG
eukprot:CAMPEP_0196765278 /NCGR_PEP_ID=MMETSP1095-20130614/7935_1 /TAXON_ID=96789 ORGANISM="Chromulina nebulosa, Strain UTEXLB2642" /NCGR_SAMPLE_ID=MMETSP1095 /ASSEMBLY_ACC=CAM_ASM_000446 /LENGTH=404 /DNA_ID=CAMNT_0042123067 /DNA_START=352 /DNA_END=1563 /DNA_ORIENTATION=+